MVGTVPACTSSVLAVWAGMVTALGYVFQKREMVRSYGRWWCMVVGPLDIRHSFKRIKLPELMKKSCKRSVGMYHRHKMSTYRRQYCSCIINGFWSWKDSSRAIQLKVQKTDTEKGKFGAFFVLGYFIHKLAIYQKEKVAPLLKLLHTFENTKKSQNHSRPSHLCLLCPILKSADKIYLLHPSSSTPEAIEQSSNLSQINSGRIHRSCLRTSKSFIMLL